jgi:hypothetical protein
MGDVTYFTRNPGLILSLIRGNRIATFRPYIGKPVIHFPYKELEDEILVNDDRIVLEYNNRMWCATISR